MLQRRAGVQYAKQHLLPFADTDWFAVTESVAIDGKNVVSGFQCSFAGGVTQVGFPAMKAEQSFRVVASAVAFRLDTEHSKLSGEGGAIQIPACGDVRVVPAGTGGTNDEGISLRGVRRNERRALLRRSINFGCNEETVPMNQLRFLCVIEDVDGHFLAFAKTENRARDGTVVADGLDDFVWSDLEFNRGD